MIPFEFGRRPNDQYKRVKLERDNTYTHAVFRKRENRKMGIYPSIQGLVACGNFGDFHLVSHHGKKVVGFFSCHWSAFEVPESKKSMVVGGEREPIRIYMNRKNTRT